jgi:TPR repeat protein
LNRIIIRVFLAAFAALLADKSVLAAPHAGGYSALTGKSDVAAATRALLRAERGDARAQAFLGFMYEHGRGVPQDYVAAVYWYTRAAEQGYATAQYLLGLMYDKGHGVERSDTMAYMWLNLAAAHAPPRMKEFYARIRDAVAAKLTAAQVDEAQWRASGFMPNAPQ